MYNRNLREDWFNNHVLTRKENPNTKKVEWCICDLVDPLFPNDPDKIGSPLIFGSTIEEAMDNFKDMLEIQEDEE